MSMPMERERERERERELAANRGPLLRYEVDKPSKILIKISSTMKDIELNIQNIEAPRRDDLII